ncbi:MAG: prepilin-type N-terminal cleavage/methylation domain-containing protein [Nitrospirota bacterium]
MKTKGFTLVEVLFAITIGLMLLGAIFVAVQSGQRSSMVIESKVAAQQDVRAALELMAIELGMASFNPTLNPNIWTTGCNSGSAVNANRGIQAVPGSSMANVVTIGMDITDSAAGPNGDGAIDDPSEVITYAYDAPNQRVTRSTSCGGSQPFLGDTAASGNPRVVRVRNDVNGNGAYDEGTDIPVFRFFDGSGAMIPFASLPANVPSIRRIEITLAVETEDIDPNTGQRRRMIYSTSVTPRNHVISPP